MYTRCTSCGCSHPVPRGAPSNKLRGRMPCEPGCFHFNGPIVTDARKCCCLRIRMNVPVVSGRVPITRRAYNPRSPNGRLQRSLCHVLREKDVRGGCPTSISDRNQWGFKNEDERTFSYLTGDSCCPRSPCLNRRMWSRGIRTSWGRRGSC